MRLLLFLACTDPHGEPQKVPDDSHSPERDQGLMLRDPASALQAYAWEQLRQLHTRGAVLIQTDTLRADHLPWYGYGRNTLPPRDAQRAGSFH